MTEWRGGSLPKRIQIESRHCLPGFATVAVKCLQLWFWVSKLKTRRKSETDVGELTLSWPTCLAWNSLYAWSERTRPNMAEQRAELISFTPASTLQLGEGGGGGVGDGLGLPPRPSLRISNSQIWNLSDLLFKAPSKSEIYCYHKKPRWTLSVFHSIQMCFLCQLMILNVDPCAIRIRKCPSTALSTFVRHQDIFANIPMYVHCTFIRILKSNSLPFQLNCHFCTEKKIAVF